MNAITPANEIPPDHSTAASGTLPTEQTKLSTAISGPTTTFQSVGSRPECARQEQAVEEVVAEQRDEAREQEAERDLLPEHLPVAAEVVGDVRPGVRGAQPLAQGQLRARGVVLVPRVGLLRVRPRLAPRRRRDTNSRSSAAISTIITMPPRYSASVNCQPIRTHRTRPSSQTRFVEANWNASAEAAEAPFWNRLFAIAIAA